MLNIDTLIQGWRHETRFVLQTASEKTVDNYPIYNIYLFILSNFFIEILICLLSVLPTILTIKHKALCNYSDMLTSFY